MTFGLLGRLNMTRQSDRLSREDETTGLPLLASVYPAIDRALRDHRPVAVLFLDLTNFPAIEKVIDPAARTYMLSQLGQVLREIIGEDLRAEDVASLGYGGGADFMIFLAPPRHEQHLLEEQLAQTARRVEDHVVLRLALIEHRLSLAETLRLQVGYARIDGSSHLPVQVLVHQAIEQASGRARDHHWLAKRELQEELAEILNGRRVTTVFQPIVSLVDGQVVAYEALTRGPVDSPLATPDKLFAAAEAVGLLRPLEQLCRQTALRLARGLPPKSRLFLNVSPDVVRDPSLSTDLLLTHDLPADRIVVELTERHAIRDWDAFERTLAMYRAQGFGIAVDDAGAGHSSLRAVAALRPDFIKIDMALVRDIDRDRAKHALVAALVTFARRINAFLVAEGIETEDELNAVVEIGVPYGQGFLIGRPDAEFKEPNSSIGDLIEEQIRRRDLLIGQVRTGLVD